MYNELNGIEMATDNLKNVEFIQKLFGTGTVNIEQFVNGNGIYVEKIEITTRRQLPRQNKKKPQKINQQNLPFLQVGNRKSCL